jgi:hypothetical protein
VSNRFLVRLEIGSGFADGTGSVARFRSPNGITTDGTNLFVADQDNHTIRKVVVATGAVTTTAGRPRYAGSGDGTGSVARFRSPNGITTDGTNLFVADQDNHTIRKVVVATGAVTTIAGRAGKRGARNGRGGAARFDHPNGITTDGMNLFVADSYNHTIRKVVIATGAVTTIAGRAGKRGFRNGRGGAARFDYPNGITTDGINLYVVDFHNYAIRKVVIATGEVTAIVASRMTYGAGDGAERFYYPNGITTDGIHVYFTDSNHTIRKVVIATGEVTTIAGSPQQGGSTDSMGSAARFGYPSGIIRVGTDLYVTDGENHNIRKIVIATGVVTTIAGDAAQ